MTDVDEFRDASAPELAAVTAWLGGAPVANNLVLTIIETAVDYKLDATVWVARSGDRIDGVAVRSPHDRSPVLSAMAAETATCLAGSVPTDARGVIGEASAAAAFAGAWTERNAGAVTRIEGQRLYELTALHDLENPSGGLRLATQAERSLLARWTDAFVAETGDQPQDAEAVMRWLIGEQRVWVWDDGEPRAMARVSKSTGSVTRVGAVFTPPEHRCHGYGTACVARLSRQLVDAGERCVLFTQLSNPTSNAIYRRIGYTPVAEILVYTF